MAGSRLEGFGSIFTRMAGLLRTGGVKATNKPIWFEVWQAFPPKADPVLDRPEDPKPLRQIYYPEDKIRARYYSEFYAGSAEAIDLTDPTQTTECKRFMQDVEMAHLQNPNVSQDEICNRILKEWKDRRNEMRREQSMRDSRKR